MVSLFPRPPSHFEIAMSPAQIAVLVAVLKESLAYDPSHRPDSYDPDQDVRAALQDMLSMLEPDTLNDLTA